MVEASTIKNEFAQRRWKSRHLKALVAGIIGEVAMVLKTSVVDDSVIGSPVFGQCRSDRRVGKGLGTSHFKGGKTKKLFFYLFGG